MSDLLYAPLRVGDLPLDPPDETDETDETDENVDARAMDEIARARAHGGQAAEDLAEEIGASTAGYALLHDALVQYVRGNEGACLAGLQDALMQAAREWVS